MFFIVIRTLSNLTMSSPTIGLVIFAKKKKEKEKLSIIKLTSALHRSLAESNLLFM